MNSWTSRPRSPTRPITATSGDENRASIDISDDLPTPEPAKMPMRWPRQQVRKVLMARTPRSIFLPTRWRVWAGGGLLRIGTGCEPLSGARSPSTGSPRALTTRPSQWSEGKTEARSSLTSASQPRPTPSRVPSGISSALPCRKPTTSHGTRRWSRAIRVQRPLTDSSFSIPATSTSSPWIPETRPKRRCWGIVDIWLTNWSTARDMGPPQEGAPWRQRRRTQPCHHRKTLT